MVMPWRRANRRNVASHAPVHQAFTVTLSHAHLVMHLVLLQVSPTGKVLQSFHDPSGNISMVTAVTEYGGKLYTGHLSRGYITVLDLKDVPSL